VGSGWTIYNNKGDPVRQYEPFFDDTHDFKFDMKIGVSPIIMYDPLSRVVATLQPDHSLDKIVFDPWSQTCYDRNDNVEISNPRHDPDIGHFFKYLPEFEYLPSWYDARIGRLLGPYEKAAAVKSKAHSNTPSVSHLDALKRAILVTEDNGAGKLFSTRVNFDIQGNALDTIDALGRIVARFDFSVSGDTIHQASMEAGEKWELCDVLGNPFLIWNSRGFRFRRKYDSARRHTESWVRQGTSDEILYHQIVYGESATNTAVRNLRGRIYTIRDQAGEAVSNEFDFKGNLLSSGRQFAKSYKGILDWSHPVDLESTFFTVTTSYDALNRPLQSVAPDMSITNASYNESGILDKKFVNIRGEQSNPNPSTWTPIYTRVDCNAKSQLTNVYYGNGTVSSWTYDPLTYRLTRLQTTRASATSIVQDLNYSYDPVGNITHVMDNAQQSIYFRNNRIDPGNDYTYDPVYRLVVATGREHLGQVSNARMVPSSAEINNGSSPTDGNAMGSYTESYLYDDVGNILSLNHAGDDPRNPGWTRTYSYNEQSQLEAAKTNNRLSSTTVGSNSERYTYDIHGNMTSMSQIPEMRWDFRDQLCSTSKQIVTNGRTSETTFYVYDAGKNRARKATERQAGPGSAPTRLKETLYLGGLEKFVKYGGDGSTVVLDRESLHIDNDKCSVLAETTTRPGDTPSVSQLVRFQYSDSSGSVTLELDDTAQIITYEEYSPYGNTTYKATRNQAEAHKRYRYTKKERDTETGLYYYGARYYICWLGRWLSCDPGGLIDGPNLYQFALSNPRSLNDPTGQETGPDSTPIDKGVVGADGKFTGNESVEELHKTARAAGWDFTGTPVWNGHQWVCESAFLLKSGASNDTGGKGAKGNEASAKKEPKTPHPEESGGGGPDPVLRSFAYGALVGFGTGLVVGLAAGAALAVGGAVAVAVVSGVAVLGALALGITIGELITGEDLSGHKLTAQDKAFIVGGLVGGAIGGAVGGSAGQALGRGVRGLLSSRASQIPPTLLPPPAQPTPETLPPPETPQTPTDTDEPGHTGKGFQGSKRYELRNIKPEGAKRNSKLKVTRNTETVINGRKYSAHAQDDMQNRGVMPSVVENTIAHGKVVPGTSMDRVVYYEPDNDVFVILQGDEVRSTYFRDPNKPIP
jgi:RHS repeat-associated protein